MSILITDKNAAKSKKKVRFNINNNDNNVNDDTISQESHHQKLSPLQIAHRRNVLGTKDMFLFNYGMPLQIESDIIEDTMKLKINNQFSDVQNHPLSLSNNHNNKQTNNNNNNQLQEPPKKKQKISHENNENKNELTDEITTKNIKSDNTATIIESVIDNLPQTNPTNEETSTTIVTYDNNSSDIATRIVLRKRKQKPGWHRPWKLYKMISGHLGWVQSVCMDPSNEYFVTGAADRTIKIWDLSSGSLKLTLTGHISSVRGLAISSQSPYMFSCGEDKKVCCWDLTQNKIIRHYHGHLSGVYCLALHPTLNILFTGGRDSSCRVWDIRTKAQIMVLSGHKHTVLTCKSQAFRPQIITGSMDKTMRTWDLRNHGKTITVLTHHKKSIRSLAIHPTEYTFMSGGSDNIKVWKCPNADFLRNMNEKPMNIIETLAINEDNLLISGHQTGHLKFWDYKTGYKQQEVLLDPQPGSLHSEAGILASTFDITGTRLITTEADKSIKMWKADKNAVPP